LLLIGTPRPAGAALTGILLGLAALTRSVLWPFVFLIVPLTLWSLRGQLRSKLPVAGALVLGYVVVVMPWAIRNTRLQGTFTVVDTMGGMNLRMGNYEFTPHDRMWDAVALTGEKNWSYELLREKPAGVTFTEGQKEKWAQRKAVAFMVDHPGLTLQRSLIKFRDFWGLERELVAGIQRGVYRLPRLLAIGATLAVGAAYVTTVLLAIVGLVAAPPRDLRAHLFLLAVILLITGIHTIVFGHSRYHLPLVPILLLYAGSAVSSLRSARPVFRIGTLLPTAALAGLMLCLWTQELLVSDSGRLLELLKVLR
jgi:hypothetical protein